MAVENGPALPIHSSEVLIFMLISPLWSKWEVGEIGILVCHCGLELTLENCSLLFGVGRSLEEVWSSCLGCVLEKFYSSLYRLSSRSKPCLSWSWYPSLLLSTFRNWHHCDFTESSVRAPPPLKNRQNSRLVWSWKAELFCFIVLQWNFQFLCAGLAFCWLIYMKSWQESVAIILIYLLICVSGPSGEVLKQYQKKKT